MDIAFLNNVVRRVLSDPGLGIKAGASATAHYYNSFQFVAGGLLSAVVAPADAPSLLNAPLIGAYPNGSAPTAGVLLGDNGSTNTGILCSRIYALVADLGTNDGSTAPVFSWLAGPDFTKYEYPSVAYFPKPDKSTSCIVGYLWITNKSSGNFTPATTALDATNISSSFLSEAEGLSGAITLKKNLTSSQILALNTTPIALLPTLPSTQAYQIISVIGRHNFLTAAYGTNTEIDIIDTTLATVLFSDASALMTSTSTKVATIPVNTNSGVGVLVTAGGGISAKAATGNPATGAGSLDIYITYKVITL